MYSMFALLVVLDAFELQNVIATKLQKVALEFYKNQKTGS